MASPDEGSSSLHLGGRSLQRGGRGKRPASTSVSSADTEIRSPGFRRRCKLIRLRIMQQPRTPTAHISGDRPRCEVETPEQGRSPRSSSPDDSGPASPRDPQPQPPSADVPGKERRSRSFSPLPRPISPEPAATPTAATASDQHQPRPASSGSSHSQRAAQGPPVTADFSNLVQDDACEQRAERSAASRPRKTRRRRAAPAVKRRRHRQSQERRDRARDPQRKRRRRQHRTWPRRKRRSLSPPGDRSGGSSASRSPSPHSSQDSPPAAGTSSSGKEITLARAGWRAPPVVATVRRLIPTSSTAGTSSAPRSKSPEPNAAYVDSSKLKSSLKDSSAPGQRLMFTRFDLRPQSKGAGASGPTSQDIYNSRRVAIDLGLVLVSELLNIIWFSFNPSSIPLAENHESHKWRRKMEENSALSTVLKSAAKNRPSEFQQLPELMKDAIQLCLAADSICNTRNHMVHYNHDALEEVLESIEAFKREKLLNCLNIKNNDSPKVKDVIELLKHFLTSAHILVNVLLDNRLYLKLVEQMLVYFAYAAGLVVRRLDWLQIIKGSKPNENKIGKEIIQSIYDQIEHGRKGNVFANKVKRPTRFNDPVPQTVMRGGIVALAQYIDEKMFFIKTTIGPSTIAASCYDLSETVRRFEKYSEMNIITQKVLSQCELFYTIVSCTVTSVPQLGMTPTAFDNMKIDYKKELDSSKQRTPHLWLD